MIGYWTTVAIDPVRYTQTVGPLSLQLKQNNLNNVSNIPKNTMNFGSSAGSVPSVILIGKRNWNRRQMESLVVICTAKHRLFIYVCCVVMLRARRYSES